MKSINQYERGIYPESYGMCLWGICKQRVVGNMQATKERLSKVTEHYARILGCIKMEKKQKRINLRKESSDSMGQQSASERIFVDQKL